MDKRIEEKIKKINSDGLYAVRSYELPVTAELSASMNGDEHDGEPREAVIEGLAAVYGVTVDVDGMFSETIERGAFANADLSDVAFYCNHETDKIPAARMRKSSDKNTLEVWDDTDGLHCRARLDVEKNLNSRALVSAIERGDISGMSLIFIIDEETWNWTNSEYPARSITKVKKVIEVSAVNYPVYGDTEIGVSRSKRSLESDRTALESAKMKRSMSELELIKSKINFIGM